MKKSILSKPALKTAYIDNQNGDKVLYLEISENVTRTMMENEVGGNGKHFASTLKYINIENRSRMILISAESQEQGLLAVNYIAGALGDNYCPRGMEQALEENVSALFMPAKEYYTNGEQAPFWDDYLEEKWNECRGKIPVIHSSDVACFYSSGYTGVDFGMTLRTGQNERNNAAPYWTRCKKEAICVVLDDNMGRQEIRRCKKGDSLPAVLFWNKECQ